MYPNQPRTKYPVTPDGSLPEVYKRVLDPIEALTFVAAHTSRIGLGTSVLDIPFYNPVTLARRLTPFDILSNGRLRAGFGLGWSVDEFEAAGANQKERGARADEFLARSKRSGPKIWWSFTANIFLCRPRSSAPNLSKNRTHRLRARRPQAATLANGWMPLGIPLQGMRAMIAQLRQMAKDAGRGPQSLEVIVGANISIAPKSLSADQPIFAGSLDEIKKDINDVKKLGANEFSL